jgi:hypothetical protein
MMSSWWAQARRGLLTLLVGLAACGGGVEVGGTGTGSTIVGPVSGFGSIIIDGVRIDDSSALIRNADGAAIPRASVRLGTFVEATTGPISDDGAGNRSATAQIVQIRTELRGVVQDLDLLARRIVVLGQVVVIGPNTVIDDGLLSLRVGRLVEVHGSLDVQTQRFIATRIEAVSGNAEFKVRGLALNVTASPPRLTIAGQGFDLERTGIPAGLVNGQYVELRVEPVQRNGLWVAVRASVGDRRPADGQQAEIEGAVSAFTSATQFSVDGVPVDARTAAFVGPAMALGAEVKVRGRMDAGVLLASLVVVETEDDDRELDLRDSIASVNTANQTLVLRVRQVTVFYGSPDVEFRGGTVAELAAGRNVRIKGKIDIDGQHVVAERIDFTN